MLCGYRGGTTCDSHGFFCSQMLIKRRMVKVLDVVPLVDSYNAAACFLEECNLNLKNVPFKPLLNKDYLELLVQSWWLDILNSLILTSYSTTCVLFLPICGLMSPPLARSILLPMNPGQGRFSKLYIKDLGRLKNARSQLWLIFFLETTSLHATLGLFLFFSFL